MASQPEVPTTVAATQAPNQALAALHRFVNAAVDSRVRQAQQQLQATFSQQVPPISQGSQATQQGSTQGPGSVTLSVPSTVVPIHTSNPPAKLEPKQQPLLRVHAP